MSAPQQIRTTLSALLPILEARLALITGLDPTAIRPFIGDQPPHTLAAQDIVYRSVGWQSDQAWWQGGGNYAKRMKERMELRLRTRLQLDEAGTSRQWLEDPVLGHLQMRNLILAALDGWTPTDSNSNALTTEQVVVESGQTPKQDDPRSEVTDWGEERMFFYLDYLMAYPALGLPQ